MKIRTQMFLVGICLTILPLGLVSFMLISVYNKEIDSILESDLINVTTAQIQIIDTFFKERDINMEILSEYPMVVKLLKNSNEGNRTTDSVSQSMLEQILENQKNKHEFLYSITIVDKELNIVACTEETSLSKAEELQKLDFLEELEDKAHFSRILSDGELGIRRDCLVAIKAIYDSQYRKIGYFIEEISLDFFENIRINTDLINQGYIYILDGLGGLITAGSGNEQRKEYALDRDERGEFNDAWAERNLDKPVGVIRYRIDNKEYMSSYGGFTNASLQIMASVCLDDIFHTKESFITILFFAVVITILLAGSVNYFVNRRVTAPINHMIAIFNEIRKSHDFGKRIKNIPQNEIGIIANEINTLLENIEEIIRHQEEHLQILKERAERDPLTNLFNKTAIEEVVNIKMEHMAIKKKTMACVVVDIDDFKDFNTNYGHIGGDKVIKHVAAVMKNLSNDTAGRIGGDEFIMCLDNIESIKDVERIIEKFLDTMREGLPNEEKESPVAICCSVGVTLIDSSNKLSFLDILEKADKIMYDVKNTSKNNYKIEFFH